MTEFQLIYLVSVGLLGPLFIFAVYRFIKRVEKSRKNRVKKEQPAIAIETSSPLDDTAEQIRSTALDNIGTRFSIIERIFVLVLIIVWALLLILPFLNTLPATIVSVFVGTSAVIVGMTARPFIENLISGVIISFSKPFHVGDTVLIDKTYGTVEDITLTYTIVRIWDWRRHVIPNSQMLSKDFINYTLKDQHIWMKVEFWASYDADIDLIQKLAMKAAKSSPHFIPYEEPSLWVMQMGQQSYKCWIAAWSDSPANAWELGNDIRMSLLRQFRKHGIAAHDFVLKEKSRQADED